jgi:glycine cleavage system H protein
MTVILMILMFSVFLTIDYFLRRKQVAPQAVVAKEQPLPKVIPTIVAGFRVPENLSYHPGHTWALRESANLVRVGADDFATKLVGKIEKLTLPQRGQWIRQGQRLVTMLHNGKSVEMVSPIEGTVTSINEAAIENPEAMRKDPYGEGWLVKVDSPDSKINFRNLLHGAVVRSWMEDTARQFRAMMSPMAPVLAQDGGVAVDDLSSHLTDEEWSKATREFFLG